MATEQEVRDAEMQADDNGVLAQELTDLADIVAGSETIEILIKRGDKQFNLTKMVEELQARNANQDTMVTNIETHILALIGADEVTQGTIRKEIRDLITLHEADIAAT